MSYKKEIKIIMSITTLVLILIGWSGYMKEFIAGDCMSIHRSMTRCVEIIFFEEYQALALMLTSTLLSLIPLYFLKEGVYKAWKKFALVALPAIAIIIFLSPANSPGDYISLGYDREVASMFFSTFFLIASWGIAVYHHLLKR